MTGKRPIRALSKEDRDEACRLSVMLFLWNVLNLSKNKTDYAAWAELGLNDTEEFLDCLETGRSHPVLDTWEQRRRDVANRPASSEREKATRRLIVLACEALVRREGGKDHARRLVAKELAAAKAFANPPSADAIYNWQRAQPQPFKPEEENIIKTALNHTAGADDSHLVKYFLGLIRLAHDPAPLQQIKRVP